MKWARGMIGTKKKEMNEKMRGICLYNTDALHITDTLILFLFFFVQKPESKWIPAKFASDTNELQHGAVKIRNGRTCLFV